MYTRPVAPRTSFVPGSAGLRRSQTTSEDPSLRFFEDVRRNQLVMSAFVMSPNALAARTDSVAHTVDWQFLGSQRTRREHHVGRLSSRPNV